MNSIVSRPLADARVSAALLRSAPVAALAALVTVFAFLSPNFLTPGNLTGILVNNVALPAIVAIAMTLVVAAGGIDLSVGTAVDLASLTLVVLVLNGQPLWVAAPAAIAAGLAVGLFNAGLIVGLGITPFLATLGTLFIGRSLQQLLTGGGNPIYVKAQVAPAGFAVLGHGALFGIPVSLLGLGVLALAVAALLGRTMFGRIVTASGLQPSVAWYSGLPVGRTTAWVYVLSGGLSAFAGILISTTVNVYVPYAGNAFLLNAIGATFIGTTLSARRRPNVTGSLIGMLLLGVVANGLLLSGINYYWQQVGTGLVIFAILALAFARRS